MNCFEQMGCIGSTLGLIWAISTGISGDYNFLEVTGLVTLGFIGGWIAGNSICFVSLFLAGIGPPNNTDYLK